MTNMKNNKENVIHVESLHFMVTQIIRMQQQLATSLVPSNTLDLGRFLQAWKYETESSKNKEKITPTSELYSVSQCHKMCACLFCFTVQYTPFNVRKHTWSCWLSIFHFPVHTFLSLYSNETIPLERCLPCNIQIMYKVNIILKQLNTILIFNCGEACSYLNLPSLHSKWWWPRGLATFNLCFKWKNKNPCRCAYKRDLLTDLKVSQFGPSTGPSGIPTRFGGQLGDSGNTGWLFAPVVFLMKLS